MASLPGIRQTVRDGALGLLALGSDLHLKIGLCTDGEVGEVQLFADPQVARDTLGRGALVESTVFSVTQTGHAVAVVRAAQTAAGSVGAFTQSGDGPAIAAAGSEPEDAFELIVEILVGGSVDEATFRYSLDGGDTWSAEIALGDSYEGAEYEVPDSGIILQFPEGAYVTGTTYAAECTPPAFDATSLAAALDAAIAFEAQYRLIHVVGYASSAVNAATLAAAVAAKMSAAEAEFRYTYTILEAPDVGDTALKEAFASFASTRVGVAAGFEELASAISGRVYKRPAAWSLVARIMGVAVSRDPGAVADGPLPGIARIYRDEGKTPNLDVARFATLRTFRGRPGFYVTRGRLMAPPGSDFADVPNRQVLDVASRVAYESLLEFVNVDLLLNPDTGFLLEQEARAIEAFVLGRLRTALLSPDPPDASDVQFVVKRDDNILSSQTLRAKTRVLPKGYARWIENEIAFRNPALETPPTE